MFVLASFLVAGCGVADQPVPLLTDEIACFAGGETGVTERLVADPQEGITFAGQPVMWPNGYTAHRAGSEVAIVDGHGALKAVTGRTYHISHALSRNLGMGDVAAFVAAVDCGYPWDFIDCTAAPDNQYCTKE